MCVGVPGKIIEKNEYTAVVDVIGSQTNVGNIFVPEVELGGYVIVHTGLAISIVDEQYAKDSVIEWRKFVDARNSRSVL